MLRATSLAFVVLLTGVLAGAGAPVASADTLYAAAGVRRAQLPCTSTSPCNAGFAISQGVPGDDVALGPGDYYSPGSIVIGTPTPFSHLEIPAGVVVHGTPGAARPVLHGLTPSGGSFVLIDAGATLRDAQIDMENQGTFGAYAVWLKAGAVLERTVVRATTALSQTVSACYMEGGTILDTLCLVTGAGTGTAINAASTGPTEYVVRSTTAINTAGDGDGLDLTGNLGGVLHASNLIVRGPTWDVDVFGYLNGGSANFLPDHSNWRTVHLSADHANVFDGPGNQTGPTAAGPLFVDAAAGDYRQAPGSPTIDAGSTDPANGSLALDGQARTLGAGTDIGADEFSPPPGPGPPSPPSPTPDPGSPSGVGGASADTTAPTLSGLALGRRWTRARGTTIRFTLSEPAQVTFNFGQPANGRLVAGRCRATTRRNRAAPRCTLVRARGSVTVSAHAGGNSLRFTGQLASGAFLATGAYHLTATATDPTGNRGTPRTARFAIAVPRHARRG